MDVGVSMLWVSCIANKEVGGEFVKRHRERF
jgi:hypothetical protein